MITTKEALLAFMRNRPDERLEYCAGIRGKGWWWVRVPMSSSTETVHARAARGVINDGSVVRDPLPPLTRQYYRLAE